jgi:hypothetical protein
MMTSKIRFTVILLALLMMVWAISNQTNQIAGLIGLGIGYLIWSYFKEGTVFMATQAFHKKDYARTKALLEDIKKPQYLRKGRRNYYEFMLGNLALKEEAFDKAEYHFQIASRLPFRRPNDKAIILVNLANINLRKKDFERVRGYLAKARELEVSSRVAQIINKIENEIPKKS